MKQTPEHSIDQLLDIYIDAVPALKALPEIPPEIGPNLRDDLLAMDQDKRAAELEWLKAHLEEVISKLTEAQKLIDQAKELLEE